MSIDYGKKRLTKKHFDQSDEDKMILDETQVEKVKKQAKLVKNSFPLVVFISLILPIIITKNVKISLYAPSILILLYGLYIFLGIIKRYRFIYCFIQLEARKEMTPNEIYWNTLSKSEKYGYPIAMLVLGIILLSYAIFG